MPFHHRISRILIHREQDTNPYSEIVITVISIESVRCRCQLHGRYFFQLIVDYRTFKE
jgi:hypothetical protein